MAGSTPIYGFPYPESSDLVANYPALGEQLAEDIESTISGLPAAGLSLVSPTSIANSGGSASASGGAVTFTGVSSVSLNGLFTSAYDNYYLVLNATHSGNNSTLMRLRATGTDNTSSNYDASGYYGGTGSGNGITNASTSWAIVVGATASNRLITATINDPFKSTPTMMSGTLYETNNSATQYWYGFGMGHRSSASFDGFTLSFGVSTTGTIRTYGYKNS